MAQESWKRDSDETGCQAPEGPSLCANNCGFFGSAATMNFCSKCYRELLLKQAKASSAAAVVEKSSVAAMKFEQSVEKEDQSARQSICAGAEGTSSGDLEKRPANRCNFCRKRVGLTGFNCRCGDTFCSLHRYSDKHNCPFDYQKAGREAIAKANPVVKAEKIEKI